MIPVGWSAAYRAEAYARVRKLFEERLKTDPIKFQAIRVRVALETHLTPAQRDVFHEVIAHPDLSEAKYAKNLHMSPDTVAKHLRAIYVEWGLSYPKDANDKARRKSSRKAALLERYYVLQLAILSDPDS